MKHPFFFWGKCVLPLVLSAVAFGCAGGPKRLDKSEVTNPVVISSALFFARAELFDSDGQCREDFQALFRNNIEKIKEYAAQNEQIILDETALISAITDTNAIQVKDIVLGGSMTLKSISWEAESHDTVHASLAAVGPTDGTITVTVNIVKDDPAYKPGYKLKFECPLQAAN